MKWYLVENVMGTCINCGKWHGYITKGCKPVLILDDHVHAFGGKKHRPNFLQFIFNKRLPNIAYAIKMQNYLGY